MSGHSSYPSPASSHRSLSRPASRRETASLSSERSAEADRRIVLQDALQDAFNRLREIRRELMGLPPRPSASHDHQQIGPGHESITLTGQEDFEFELDRIRAQIARQAREGLRQFETGDGRSSPSSQAAQNILSMLGTLSEAQSSQTDAAMVNRPPTSSSIASHPVPDSNLASHATANSPMSPPRQTLLPRRQLPQTQSLQPRELDEDPNTTLGRRVAARESGVGYQIVTPPSVVQRRPRVRLSSDFDNLRRTMERMDTQSSDNSSSPSPQRGGTSSTTSSSSSTNQDEAASSLHAARNAWNYRRMRMMRSQESFRENTRSTVSSQRSMAATSSSSRLSTLSNFSIQNLPSPMAGPVERSLLFEEPFSYVASESPVDSEPRNYRLRRRLDPDGNEVMHNLSMVIAEEEAPVANGFSRERSRGSDDIEHTGFWRELYERRRSLSLMPVTDDNMGLPSRHGLPTPARFGETANMMSDEDEELERLRTQQRNHSYHVRAAQLMANEYARARNVPTNTVGRRAVYSDSENEPPNRSLSVRYGDRYPDILDDSESELFEACSDEGFRADPLPVPLTEMVRLSSVYPDRRPPVRVAKTACFAGR